MDIKKHKSVESQSYTLYLGGVRRENLAVEVMEGKTMAQFAKQLGIRWIGFLIEYQLHSHEDLIIVSLLMQPDGEPKYICRCLNDRAKMPLHIFRGDTTYALQRLPEICSCHSNFHMYTK